MVFIVFNLGILGDYYNPSIPIIGLTGYVGPGVHPTNSPDLYLGFVLHHMTYMTPSARWLKMFIGNLEIQGHPSRDNWGIMTHKFPLYRAYIGISNRGTLEGVHPTMPWIHILGFVVLDDFFTDWDPMANSSPWKNPHHLREIFCSRHRITAIQSWEPKGTPPMPRFLQEIAGLIKGLWSPLVSLNKALLGPAISWGGWHWGGALRFPWYKSKKKQNTGKFQFGRCCVGDRSLLVFFFDDKWVTSPKRLL